MFLVLLLLVAIPLLEIAVFVQVASTIGVLDAVGILLLCSIGGLLLVRHEGMNTWARARGEMNEGRMPTGHLADGFWLLVAGLLLLVPGFVTDAAGLLLLLPPVRGLAKRTAGRRFTRSTTTSVVRIEGLTRDVPGDGVIDATSHDHRDPSERGDPPELLP